MPRAKLTVLPNFCNASKEIFPSWAEAGVPSENYSRHVAALALHFGKAPTELDPEDIKDYLFELQKRSKTPSQSYFKHTVYGLRFLLKTEGLPYSYLHLPAIPKVKKLPTILSREEIWRMLQSAELLKHRLLIGLIYGCGLRCMEVRNIKLQHLDFDRKMLLNKCRCCKEGNLVTIAVFGQRGPPQDFLFVTQPLSAK